jgi:signal transduction histidine kinase/CheY-like chemotaxis protein
MSGEEGSLGDIRRALAGITSRLDALAAAVGAREPDAAEPPGARLDEATRRELAALESLLGVARGLGEVDAALLAADRALWAGGADCAAVVAPQSGGAWCILGQRGFASPLPRETGEIGGIVARAATLREPVQAAPGLGGPDPWLARHGLDSGVALPVMGHDGGVVAVLLAGRRRATPFDTDALGKLLVVAAALAGPLTVGRIVGDQAPPAWFESLDLPTVADAVARAAGERVGARAAAILVPEGDRLVLAGGAGLPSDAEAPPRDEAPVAAALLERQPWTASAEAVATPGLLRCLGAPPGAVLPLVADDAVVALLALAGCDPRRARLAPAFLRPAAVALRNAQLHAATADRRAGPPLEGPGAPGPAHVPLGDLANLLAVVLGRLAALREHGLGTEAARELDVAERAAWRAADAVHQILGFAPGPRDAQDAPLDLAGVVRGTVQASERRWAAEGGGPPIELDLETVPPVRGSPDEIRHALEHLLQNAREASGPSIPVVVRLRWDRQGHVELAVTDRGRGMDEATRSRAGEPFFTTKGPGRLGVGLAVARATAARHRGALELESVPGGGTTVRLRLPTPASPPARPGDRSPRRARVLLVVEDEAPVRETLVLGLGRDGALVRGADDIAPALAILQHEVVDAVVTDLALPGGSGLEVARIAKRLRPGTIVVLMTGWPGRVQGGSRETQDVDAVVEKPIGLDTLRATLAALLARSSAPQA